MKKIILFIILIAFNSCNAQKNKIVSPPTIKEPTLAETQNNIVFQKKDFWVNETGLFKNKINTYKSLQTVKKQYSIKEGKLFYNRKLVDNLEIYYLLNQETMYITKILYGETIEQIINVDNNPLPSMYNVKYYKNGNISFKYLNKESFLTNGTGNLKIYNYGFWDGKNQKYNEGTLKEEGNVKQNFKLGEWKYYSKEGKIDSTKTYTLKDSVDVRFPHCIFNKNEPCY